MKLPLESENPPVPGMRPAAAAEFGPDRFSDEATPDDSLVDSLTNDVSAQDLQEPSRPPGPGILTGLLWMLSVLIIHVVGILIAGIVLFATNLDVLQEVARNPQAAGKIIDPFLKDNTFFMMAGEMLVFALAAILMTRLKHGRQTSQVLGLRPIRLPMLALIVASVLPLSLLCSGLHQNLLPVWEDFAAAYPTLDRLSGTDVNEQLLPLGKSTSAWLLLLVIAVAPAIGEELIFRGIIGHGLVARHGLFIGVFVSSVFFAAVHIHPAHVLTLMPLAVFLHLSWLATRSFYAPVLIHFLNNALAVFVLKNAEQLQQAAKDSGETEGSWVVIGVSAFVLIPATIALWKNRVEFRMEDGGVWSPGYETAAGPPADVTATVVDQIREPWPYTVGLFLCGGFSTLFVVSTLAALLQ